MKSSPVRLWCLVSAFAGLMATGCSGGAGAKGGGDTAADSKSVADPYRVYGDLEVGADYESYTKVNKEPWQSGDHGNRFVDVWVNDVGLEAYKNEDAEIPVGTIVVKTSWESKDGKPTEVAGPIFVMEKRAAGYDSEREDWWYALHWAEVPEKFQKVMGGPSAYWRSPSPKAKYCWDCHENYSRQLGGVPDEVKAW